MRIDADVDVRKAVRLLDSVAKGIQNKAMRKGYRGGGKVALREVRAATPRGVTGRLARSPKLSVRKDQAKVYFGRQFYRRPVGRFLQQGTTLMRAHPFMPDARSMEGEVKQEFADAVREVVDSGG